MLLISLALVEPQMKLKVSVNVILRSLALPLHTLLLHLLPALVLALCPADISDGLKRGKTHSQDNWKCQLEPNWPPVVD